MRRSDFAACMLLESGGACILGGPAPSCGEYSLQVIAVRWRPHRTAKKIPASKGNAAQISKTRVSMESFRGDSCLGKWKLALYFL